MDIEFEDSIEVPSEDAIASTRDDLLPLDLEDNENTGRNTTCHMSPELSPIISSNLEDTVMTFQEKQQTLIADNIQTDVKKLDVNLDSDLQKTTKHQPIKMLLLGKTGHGKSSTGNTILSESQGSMVDMVFKEDISPASVTRSVERVTRVVCGRELTVVDTPGMCDTEKDPDATLKEIASAIEKSPDGYDAFIFILRFPMRMTHEEHSALKHFEQLFGTDESYRYSIALFTHGDNFAFHQKTQARKGEKVLSFEEEILKDDLSNRKGAIGSIIKEKCKGGVVLFDNHEEDAIERRVMVNRLLDKIDEMMTKNGHQRFTNDIFEYASSLESLNHQDMNIAFSDDQNNLEVDEKEKFTVLILRYMKRVSSCCIL